MLPSLYTDVRSILMVLLSFKGSSLWKQLVSPSIAMSGWTAPQSPNGTYKTPGTEACEPFCVFDLLADPSEYKNLVNDTSAAMKAVTDELTGLMQAGQAGGFRPVRGPQDPQSCIVAMEKYEGWWGPWIDAN